MPPSRPLNPTVLMILVAIVWVAIEVAFSTPWIVTLLIAAVVIQGVFWLHQRWTRRRQARALDPSRPYSREDESG